MCYLGQPLIFLQIVICFNLISGIQAFSDVDGLEQGDAKYPAALKELHRAMQAGPFHIEPVAPTGELRGFTFPGFDITLYKFFETREFVAGKPCRMLDYACGSGRWAANAVLQAELNKFSLNITAIDPFMQSEHAEYYNNEWSTYVRDNRSSHGSLSVSQGWLRDVQSVKALKFNSIVVRDAIHLFSDAQVAELCQLGSILTDENGSIVMSATPPFSTVLWDPRLKMFLMSRGLNLPNFREIFFNESSFKAYSEVTAKHLPGALGQMQTKSVCLPAIRNVAEANGWGLQAIQVGTTAMTHTKPLTEAQLYTFISAQIMQLKPKPAQYNLAYSLWDPGVILRFKKCRFF